MEQFSYLIKKKNKAVKVFQDAHKALRQVSDDIRAVIQSRHESINDHTQAIEQDKAEIEYLHAELASNIETTRKVEAIIN